MHQLEKTMMVVKMLIGMFFEEGLLMLAQGLLDGMRAIPSLRWTIEFIMGLSDSLCLWIAAALGVLTIVAFGVGMVIIRKTISHRYNWSDKGLLLLCTLLSASFGFLALVFISAAAV